MKRTALLFATLLLALPTLGQSAPATTQQNEVLVTTTSGRVDVGIEQRKGIEIQNLGPNAIFCKVSNTTPTAVLNKSRRIGTNEAWAIDLPSGYRVSCIAATGNQVTGAATIVTEVR